MSEEKKQDEKQSVIISESGSMKAQTVQAQLALANVYVKSGTLPKGYDTPEKVVAASQMAIELGLKPLTGLKNIAVINGTPSLWGDAPLGLVKASGKLEYIEEYFLDDKQEKICIENKNLDANIFAAVCKTKRKGEPIEKISIFTKKDVEKMGVAGRDVWTKHFAIMIKRKARAISLKDNFPDILMGVSIAEYDHNTTLNDDGDFLGQPEKNKLEIANSLNQKFMEVESEE